MSTGHRKQRLRTPHRLRTKDLARAFTRQREWSAFAAIKVQFAPRRLIGIAARRRACRGRGRGRCDLDLVLSTFYFLKRHLTM